jgi:hypothetical protein
VALNLSVNQQIADPVMSSVTMAVGSDFAAPETAIPFTTGDVYSPTATTQITMPPPIEELTNVETPKDLMFDDTMPEHPTVASSFRRGRGRPKKIPASGRPSRLLPPKPAQSLPNQAPKDAEHPVKSATLPATEEEHEKDDASEAEIGDAARKLLQDAKPSSEQNGHDNDEDNNEQVENDQEPPSPSAAPIGTQIKKRVRMTQLEKLLKDQEGEAFKLSMRGTGEAVENKTSGSRNLPGPELCKKSDEATTKSTPRRPAKVTVEVITTTRGSERRNLKEVEIVQATPKRTREGPTKVRELRSVQSSKGHLKRELAAVDAEDEPE